MPFLAGEGEGDGRMESETGASGSLWSPSRTYQPASGSVASSGPFVRRPRENVRTGGVHAQGDLRQLRQQAVERAYGGVQHELG